MQVTSAKWLLRKMGWLKSAMQTERIKAINSSNCSVKIQIDGIQIPPQGFSPRSVFANDRLKSLLTAEHTFSNLVAPKRIEFRETSSRDVNVVIKRCSAVADAPSAGCIRC